MSQEILVHFASKIPEKLSSNWTRFVCVSDTHNKIDRDKYQVPNGDVFRKYLTEVIYKKFLILMIFNIVVHAGDMTGLGKVEQVKDTINWIKNLPHKYKVIIAGNHDLTLDETFYEKNWNRFHYSKEDPKEAINIIKNAGNGVVYLNEESFTIPDKGIQIWGSPWTPEFCEWAFNGQRGQFLKEKWGQIPQTTHILMTHGPPYKILDKTHHTGENVGCVDLLERIKVIKPYVHIFGHIHEAYGVLEKTWESTDQDRKKTIFINASTTTIKYEPENAAVVFDYPPSHPL
ncbi:Metallo-dependent phosphatase-like protein [Rhizophagus diaphanus]|nr:Metallo-dependent phosphatase-like protein [Rhizophagus diaphanus] [Rhizophagus sp. MUCL 43196]